MLNDIEFIRQGIESVLIYTRSISAKCINMQVAFVSSDKKHIEKTESFRFRYREIYQKAADIADQNIIKEVINSGALTNEYTLPMAVLTEELFGVDIDRKTTQKIIELKPGVPIPTDILINTVESLLKDLQNVNREFRIFLKELKNDLKNVALAMCLFELSVENAYRKLEMLEKSIERILKRETFSPVYVADVQFRMNRMMTQNAFLMGSYMNQSETGIIRTSKIIAQDFAELDRLHSQGITPAVQKDLGTRSYTLVLNFISFIKDILNRIEKRNLQIITTPVYFENMLSEANFYKFVLEGNLKQITEDISGTSNKKE